MSADRTTFLVPCSKEFKDALGVYAQKNNTDMAKVVREAVAVLIGYDLSADSVTLGRKRKYETKEERKEASRTQYQEDKILKQVMRDALEKDERLRAFLALQKSVQ